MADAIIKRLLEEEEQVFNRKTRNEALTALRNWIQENSDTIRCRSDDKFLIGFLRMREFNVHETKKMITNFCNCCRAVPKFTSNLDMCDEQLNYLASCGVMFVSPFRDQLGRRVLVLKLSALDTTKANHVDMARYQMAQLFTLMDQPDSQLLGYVYIIDCGNINPSHATFWPVWDMIHLIKFCLKAIPMRHKEIHVMNMNSIIKLLFYLGTSVLPSKMKKRIIIHNSRESLLSLVSPDVLPLEYGGSMPSAEMCNLWKEKLLESRELIMSMENLY